MGWFLCSTPSLLLTLQERERRESELGSFLPTLSWNFKGQRRETDISLSFHLILQRFQINWSHPVQYSGWYGMEIETTVVRRRVHTWWVKGKGPFWTVELDAIDILQPGLSIQDWGPLMLRAWVRYVPIFGVALTTWMQSTFLTTWAGCLNQNCERWPAGAWADLPALVPPSMCPKPNKHEGLPKQPKNVVQFLQQASETMAAMPKIWTGSLFMMEFTFTEACPSWPKGRYQHHAHKKKKYNYSRYASAFTPIVTCMPNGMPI